MRVAGEEKGLMGDGPCTATSVQVSRIPFTSRSRAGTPFKFVFLDTVMKKMSSARVFPCTITGMRDWVESSFEGEMNSVFRSTQVAC